MFQTEIIHYLQSFASDELTIAMRFITNIGYEHFLMLFLCIMILSINLKKGFLLAQILLWTGLFTFILKEKFDLPRPFHVDNTVLLLDGSLPDQSDFNFESRGARAFWERLPTDVLEITRKSDQIENGFPSGHSSIAIAFWGGLLFLFRKKWITILCALLMILIPFSRMYLGVHFLADVLGGILLGGILLAAFYYLVLQQGKLEKYMKNNVYQFGFTKQTIAWIFAPLLFLFFLPPKLFIIVASMIGLGTGFLLLSRKGLPSDLSPWHFRLGRTIVGIGTFLIIGFILNFVAKQFGWEEHIFLQLLIGFITCMSFIWIGTEISIKLGWYKRAALV